jgi:hypothetical protein
MERMEVIAALFLDRGMRALIAVPCHRFIVSRDERVKEKGRTSRRGGR